MSGCDPDEVDRTRPIADSKRRFEATLALDEPHARILSRLTQAAGGYDWLQLTAAPASYFVWPESGDANDRFAASELAFPVVDAEVAGRSLADAVESALSAAPRELPLFDRSGLLDAVTAPAVELDGRPAFQALGDLCAHSGTRITWTLAGLGDARMLTVGAMPV